MSDNILHKILRELELFVDPIKAAANSEEDRSTLFARLGWDLERLTHLPVEDLERALTQLVDSYERLRDLLDSPLDSLEDLGEGLAAIGGLFESVRQLHRLGNLGAAPPQFDRFGLDLIEFLITDYLQTWYPAIYHWALLFTLIEPPASDTAELVRNASGGIIRVPRPRSRLRLQRLGELLSDPVGTLKNYYLDVDRLITDEDAKRMADQLFPRLGAFLETLGINYVYGIKARYGFDMTEPGNRLAASMLTIYRMSADSLPRFGITLEYSPADRGNLGLVISPFGTFDFSGTVGKWELSSTVTGRLEGFAIGPEGLTAEPDFNLNLIFSARRRGEGENGPALTIGGDSSTRLEIGEIQFTGDLNLNPTSQDFGFLIELNSGAIVIQPSDGDGFLQKVLPDDGMNINFDLGVGWSNRNGLYFRGSAGLEVTLPVHASFLGFVSVDSVYLAIRANDDGIHNFVAASANVRLGPLEAAIKEVGLKATFTLPEGGGNLGPLNLALAFKPPSGLGLVINAGPVTGGGFIDFYPEEGRYSGIFQLEIFEISVKAIGILDTRLPGGASGFSFLIIITAEFPDIQLGFGFTLNGVGGLAGIHRTMVTEALRTGIRDHSIDHILFPEDPIRNAPQIISDLSTIFPPAEGRYVFGPMALIGWGTPTLVEFELGIVIELPAPIRIALLGQVNIALPVKEAAIVELHVDFLGVLEFSAKTFSLDGTLHDSRIVLFSIYGDMAMRLSWGDQPNFVLSLGGFNPHFQPPPNCPVLRRLTVELGFGGNPRITMQSYMALTSNSVQWGSRAELYAGAGSFNIYGWAGFDVLFIFSPFSFRADLSAGVALRVGTSVIAGIYLSAALTGPTPWHVWGEACLSLLFFEICVPFDVSFGEERRDELPAVNPWTELEKAIKDARNWNAVLPPAAARVVSLTTPAVDAPPVLVDPVGAVTLREKVLPLNRIITKFGEARPEGPDHYNLDRITVGSAPLSTWSVVKDHFAPAQFMVMSDDLKLSGPSFELMDAGATMGSDVVMQGEGVGKDIEYETIIIDSPWDSRAMPRYPLSLAHQNAFLAIGAAALGGVRRLGMERFFPAAGTAPFAQLEEEGFAVATTADMTPRFDLGGVMTKGAALQTLDEHFSRHPEDRGRLQVVPTYEIEATL